MRLFRSALPTMPSIITAVSADWKNATAPPPVTMSVMTTIRARRMQLHPRELAVPDGRYRDQREINRVEERVGVAVQEPEDGPAAHDDDVSMAADTRIACEWDPVSIPFSVRRFARPTQDRCVANVTSSTVRQLAMRGGRPCFSGNSCP